MFQSIKKAIMKHSILYKILVTPLNIVRKIDIFGNLVKLFQYGIIKRGIFRDFFLYQPIYGGKSREFRRKSEDRWNKMKEHLPKTPFSFMDIGCNIGYFTFSAQNEGAVAIGVEMHPGRYELAQAIKVINKVERVSFFNFEIDKNTVMGLPSVNVICCLSVYHHWVRQLGFEEADEIFTSLCNKTDSIFFETGQPDEKVQWKGMLDFMGSDVKGWIEEYLKSKGFESMVMLGEFSTHRSDVPRHLFFASKV